MIRRTSSLRSTTLTRGSGMTKLRRSVIRKVGPLSAKWKLFRDEKAERDRDEEDLLHCQDYKIGLPRCGYGYPELDLHHIIGREQEPKLYFDETNLVWLTRRCHEKAHNR